MAQRRYALIGHTHASGGGSQTPWTADVDAASFSLDNLLGLTIEDGTAADTANFTHDGTSFNASFGNTLDFNLIALTGNFWIRDGAGLKISDLGDTDFGIFTHDGTTFDLDFTNTSDWNIAGLTGNVWIRDGAGLKISNAGDSDFGIFSHDGTDFNTAFTLTTDWNITGLTYIRAGNYNFNIAETVGAGQDNYVLTYDNGTGLIGLEAAGGGSQTPWTSNIDGGGFALSNVGAITATSYGGITAANLVDKSATETITGTWTLDGAVTTTGYGTGGRVKDGADVSRPIGFNVLPYSGRSSALTLALANNGYRYNVSTGASAFDVTLPNDTTIPAGAVWTITNQHASNLFRIKGATGVTVRNYTGAAVNSVTAGNGFTMATGAVATIHKATDTVYHIWGAGLTTS